MRALALTALAACSGGPAPPPDYPTLTEPGAAAAEPASSELQARPLDSPAAPDDGRAIGTPDPACIVPGSYTVTVDLSKGKVSQANTGMADTTWCESILVGVATQAKGSMAIRYDGARLVVEWPVGTEVVAIPRSDCSFETKSEPMPSTITFAAGKGTGTTSYQTGTPNHPDEYCAARNVAVIVSPR